ncbi:hypothetical protein MKW94_009370 [Papaver nudicaule]|uniref:Large ribosomal subunit protein bL21m n=1 Tax=Papaver nudicaule TaxID=74823 RepID=A0AA41VXG5_PAPNU|nr:hypothetical protein [Papaver nudicaule]MCL7049329.1 hypothetical protein [Papaver nudicaule]
MSNHITNLHFIYFNHMVHISLLDKKSHSLRNKTMASRRCVNPLTRHCPYLFSSNSPSLHNIVNKTAPLALPASDRLPLETHTSILPQFHRNFESLFYKSNSARHFSTGRGGHGKRGEEQDEEEYDDDDDDDDDEDESEEGELSEYSDEEDTGNNVLVSKRVPQRTYSLENKEQEAAAIGYKVVGPLDPTEQPFTPREPVFAVVQIGSHQFKVSNEDTIYTEKLKFCEVNDKLILNKVLMVGSKSQTIIGRPILPEAVVHAVVEEHALDAKVIVFKKKRRKNYRRTNGHRQELTRLRITKIEGVEIPEEEALAA